MNADQCRSNSIRGRRCKKTALFPRPTKPWERPRVCAWHWRWGKQERERTPEVPALEEGPTKERLHRAIQALDELLRRAE
jgi:hypothetical protein